MSALLFVHVSLKLRLLFSQLCAIVFMASIHS